MEISDEGAGDGVTGVGVGGVSVFFEGEGAGMGEEFLEVEGEAESGVIFYAKV